VIYLHSRSNAFRKTKQRCHPDERGAVGGTLRQRAVPVRWTRSTKLPTAQTTLFGSIAMLSVVRSLIPLSRDSR
jgi:hypothetical protein